MRRLTFMVPTLAALAGAACGVDSSGLADDLGDADGGDAEVALDATTDATIGSDDSGGGTDGARGDATVSDGATDGTVVDGGSDGERADAEPADASGDAFDGAEPHDAGMDSAPVVDAAPDAESDACGAVEVCGNGVDDDCNGLVDCADPACTSAGYSCTAGAVPPGWTVVAFSSAAGVPCPTGYGPSAHTLVAWDGGAPSSCTCGCELESSPTCENGTLDWSYGTPGIGVPPPPATCTMSYKAGAVTNGGCVATNTLLPTFPGEVLEVAPLPFSGGACGAQYALDAGVIVTTEAETCALPAGSAGQGCGDAGACVPPAANGFGLCIEYPAPGTACPQGFTAVPGELGASLEDSRSCTGCSCGAPTGTCGPGTLGLFTADNCTGTSPNATTVPANGTCNAIDAMFTGKTIGSYDYTAAVLDAGCAAPTGAPTVTGAVSLSGGVTVCCNP